MNKTFTLALSALLCSFYCLAQAPDSLHGPNVWLRADLSLITANKWPDFSFFKNHGTASSIVTAPTSEGIINFNKAITFDGVDDYLKIPFSLEGFSEITILAVFQSADTTERGIWGTEQGLSRNILLTTRRAIGPDTITDRYGKNEKITILNSVLQSWDKTGAQSSNAFMSLGSSGKSKPYKPFKGSLAELIVFNRALTFLERIQYETYLAIKYGTGSKGGNLVSAGEKVLWNTERYATYGNHMAGIGHDNFFALDQKQSGSAYDSGLLVISAGVSASTNEANKTVINDQDFLVWGDNNLPLRTKTGDGADSVLSMMQRKWLITATGNTASKIATEVYVDISRFPNDPLGYWLVIDRSGLSNYSVDNLEYINADRIANGKVVYKVLWDTDHSGKDNFSFARERNLFAIVRKISLPSCTDYQAGKVTVEVIAGKAPYRFKLTSDDGKISREWKQSTKSIEQKDLTEDQYTLTLVDDADEKLTRNFVLSMPDALHIDLGPDQKLTLDKDIVLDVSAQVPDSIPVTYRWENSFAFSSTEQKITAKESGIFKVFVTKQSDGCVFTDDVIISGAEAQRVAVFPTLLERNDAYNVSISLEEPASVAVRVMDIRGFEIQTITGQSKTEYQFTTSLKDSGMYLVVIQTPKGVETRKIIVY
jgi:hypothetical protein